MTDAKKSVRDILATLDEATLSDCKVLLEIMQRISCDEPKVWNIGTIGFGTYHYKYDTGREGDSQILSLYPRKDKITIYLMDGTTRYSKLLSMLGKHTTTGYCIYIKRLSDIELPVLEHILKDSFEFIVSLSINGPIDRILWKTES